MTQDSQLVKLARYFSRPRALKQPVTPSPAAERLAQAWVSPDSNPYAGTDVPVIVFKPVFPWSKVLCVAALVIAVGVLAAWGLNKAKVKSHANAIQADAAGELNATSMSGAAQSESLSASSMLGSSATAALSTRLRPAGFLDMLSTAGRPVQVTKIERLKVDTDSKALKLRILLYAQLDADTEKQWRDAGMFAAELGGANPFLRTVTLANPEALERLFDWHVEGAILDSQTSATRP